MARLASFVIELSEAEFQSQVCRLAETLGWDWMHVRTTGTGRNFPLDGTLRHRWLDLVLIRGERIIFAELKREKQSPLSEGQKQTMDQLRRTTAEVYCWRPSDFNHIAEVLT